METIIFENHQIVTYIQVNFRKTTIFNNYIVFYYHYHHEAILFLHLRSLTPNKNSKQRQFSIIPMVRGLLSFMYYFTFILLLSGDIELNPGPTRREEFTSLLDEKQSDSSINLFSLEIFFTKFQYFNL